MLAANLFPRYSLKAIPVVNKAQMVEVDRLMIEEYGISLERMMENAGRNLAILASVRFLKPYRESKRVAVLAGSGGNGGGALVCARHLHNRGVYVDIFLTKDPGQYRGVPAEQLNIVKRMGINILDQAPSSESASYHLIVDGIIGYSLRDAPTGGAALLIKWANKTGIPVLSLDIPSGMNCNTGEIHSPAIKADATMTLALPKTAFLNPSAKEYFGELYLADISVPPSLYTRPSLNLPSSFIFNDSYIIRCTF
ncbi:MAG TPA: NAD(P)H-hydrate epimerase [Caldithrix abyssi]|uniref:NAD(P)H-hydrate epimerase n=1 Tax=Caldithrix abyssi TaxID=187145 RepID=A0A7V4WTB9_CALAY|nr:NAD(P)H-hydrate epimerase [Caldithrix abyssi]